MISPTLLIASLFTLALTATSTARTLKLHESRKDIPAGFSLSGPAPPDTPLQLRIALVQSNFTGLEERLYDVSTPSSANYGKHLSKEEVEQLIAPKPDSIDAVTTWLASNGAAAEALSLVRDWLTFEVPVSKANELFGANFSVFTHTESGHQVIRALAYSIPPELEGHLDLVHPTTSFPNPNPHLPVVRSPVMSVQNITERAVPASCARSITPACLQALYRIPTTKATQSTNRLAVSGFNRQFPSKADLKAFLTQFRPDVAPTTPVALQTLDGGPNHQTSGVAGVQANLDIQYTVGLATGVPTVFISVGDNNHDGDLDGSLDLINFLLNARAPPQVLTSSYSQNEDTLSPELAKRLCNTYAQLTARGTSIIVASGNGGVSGSQSANCSTFVPTFPASCPFVTSVGATQGIHPETAAPFSSGGFSNIFPQLHYQATAVPGYLTALGNTHSGAFNRLGRGFPDVAAHGADCAIVVDGKTVRVDDTGCAGATFAAVVALLNDRLSATGKRPLGWLNPFLYSAAGAAAFTDITSGSNPGCGTGGFPAKVGWDPVTGLGTPDFAKLLTAVGVY